MTADTIGLIRALTDAGVEFVIVGGVAGQLHGSPLVTFDLDICHSRERSNLERLARVLVSLDTELRGAPSGLPFRLDARTLANGDSFTFLTALGPLDILATPSGTTGFDDLARTAERIDFSGMVVLVASIDDVIRMKRAAGRPKDLLGIEELGALRSRLDRPGSG